jgi:hypothetical protein
MKTNSKEVRNKIKEHILECVYDYEENEFTAIKDACNHLYSEFKRVTSEDGFLRKKSDQEKFSWYLMGLPFRFHFINHDIESYLNSLGIIPSGKKFDSEKSMVLYHYLIFSETIKNKQQ